MLDIEKWDPLAWKTAHRYAEETDDPVVSAEDIHSEILVRWLERQEDICKYEGQDFVNILALTARLAAERYLSETRWHSAPDLDQWPVRVVLAALPDILERREDWPGTAAEEAWDALTDEQREVIEKRCKGGVAALTAGERHNYYRAVDKYTQALNKALRGVDMVPNPFNDEWDEVYHSPYEYRKLWHEGPGSRPKPAAVAAALHYDYNGG